MKSSDRIERNMVMKAPLAKVWESITDHTKFGQWFECRLDGPFIPGQTTTGRITTKGYEQLQLALEVQKLEPKTHFSWRWHPYAIDPKADYSKEPTTLVELHLEEVPGGTRVTVSESGFEKLPPNRRAEAYRMNDGGWEAQLANITKYVS